MTKRLSYIFAIVVATAMMACQHDNITHIVSPEQDTVPEGMVEIEFVANTPLMTEVVVRGVDPDGIDVQNLTLFCFNDFGLYITHVAAELDPAVETPSLSGTYKAIIPEDTRIIHFVGNQNPNLFDADMFINRTEDEIQDDMVGASGMIIYWSRFIFQTGAGSHQQQLASANGGEGIKLIRNQAMVSINNPDNEWIDITGFVSTNVYAFGTTAPYHPEKRFPTAGTAFEWPGEDFVTIPQNRTKLSNITEVYTKPEEYIFEHENTLQDPVSIILRGRPAGSSEELYYRVMIIDEQGEQMMIRRNHHYKLNIQGKLTYGSRNFEDALNSPATNNVWVAVDDWVNEVSYGDITLSVDETSVVLGEDKAGQSLDLYYTIESTSALTADDMAEVSWSTGNTVASHNFNHTFTPNGTSGRGRIVLQLLEMGDDAMLEGTLIVKKGRLQRTINVVLIKTQKFTPVWAATQIYGGDIGELATFKFTVPEDFPFFPFKVYVSVNSLDVRTQTTGRVLPVVRKGDEGWYGADNQLGYKYVYTVTEPGTQRLYMHSILAHEQGGKDHIMLEAEFFETVNKEFQYASHQNAISVKNLEAYSVSGVSDEVIYYHLVPRKINAPVRIDMSLNDVSGATPRPINAGENDEFFIYTRTLDSLYNQTDRDMFGLPDNWEWDCRLYTVDDNYWQQSTNGRMLMFKPTKFDKSGEEVGNYSIFLKTNSSRSDDMIRIASNQPESYSALPDKSNENYAGNTYRSFIYELSTYHPFRFAAQVAIDGGIPVGSWSTGTDPDSVDKLEWSYLPNQKVDINLEITSFTGSDGRSADPFGTSFEVYIDAPMLKLDESRLTPEMAAKLKPHATIPGRFVYTVDASREAERAMGNGASVLIADAAAQSQAGERKTLPFVTNGITTAGEIVIRSQTEVCEFFEKRFEVTNTLINGAVKYEANGVQYDVAANEFISFAIERTGVRIGSMNVPSNGQFTLNLRAEYSFTWGEDAIRLAYINNGEVYEANYPSLKSLYESVVTRGEAIILKVE